MPLNTNEYDRVKSLYRLSIETRNFEISQLVQRNNFFMIFQGVLLAGLMQASGGNPLPIVSFLICGCGLGISILQTGMAAGAKFWQERWETEAEEKEKRLLDLLSASGVDVSKDFWKLFSLEKKISREIVEQKQNSGISGILINKKYSVSKIPIYAGLVFSLFWLALLLSTVQVGIFSVPNIISGFEPVKSKPNKDDKDKQQLECSTIKLNSKDTVICIK